MLSLVNHICFLLSPEYPLPFLSWSRASSKKALTDTGYFFIDQNENWKYSQNMSIVFKAGKNFSTAKAVLFFHQRIFQGYDDTKTQRPLVWLQSNGSPFISKQWLSAFMHPLNKYSVKAQYGPGALSSSEHSVKERQFLRQPRVHLLGM